MSGRNVVGGFLHHAASGKVLLHLRSPDNPPCAGQWAFFSGSEEPEDGGDLLATWCREMREELGVALDPTRVRSFCQGTYPAGNHWHDFYYDWPALDDNFVLTEGQRYAWFTLDAALALPDLADYARDELILFREQRQQV